MKLMSFAEINDLENGQVIPSFQGTIKKVFDQKTGEGQYGTWHLQNLILQDEHANELQVTWTCPDVWDRRDEGKHLLFESGRDKKDQLVGIKREIRTKDGKRYESVRLDDRCKITQGNVTREMQSDVDPDWPEAEKPDGLSETRKHLMQAANLQILCVKAVDKAVAEHLPEVARTSEQFQGLVAQLFIEASSRRTTDGVHWFSYVDKMPTHPLKEEK